MDFSNYYNNRKYDNLQPGNLIHYYAHNHPITGYGRWNVIEVGEELLKRFKKTFDFDGPYRPIRLNDYWMGRFGFEEDGDYYQLPGLKILRLPGMLIPIEEDRVDLKSVHELQNLYKEVTKKELSLPVEFLSAPYWKNKKNRRES